MSAAATRLAGVAATLAALVVLLAYAPSLEAPFLVPKFAALEITGSLGFVALALSLASGAGPRVARSVTAGALLVLATTCVSWIAAVLPSSGRGDPYAVDAVLRWVALFGLACAASVTRGPARLRLAEAITVSAGTVAALGLLQHVDALPLPIPVISTPGSTFGNRNLAAEVVALTIPLGLAASFTQAREGRSVMVAATAIEFIYLAVTRARGAWLGAACGVVVWLVLVRGSTRGSRRSHRLAVAVVLVAVIAAALPARMNPRDAGDAKRYASVVEVVVGGLDARAPALRTRLALFRRTAAMAMDHPVVGVGPGNWPVLFPRYAEPGALRDGILSAAVAPRQAHDDLLERLAETGALGAGAMVVLAVAVARGARRRVRAAEASGDERLVIAGATSSLAALVGVSALGFPLEMPGTLAVAGLSLGLAVGSPTEASEPAPRATAASAVSILLALVLVTLAGVRAERHLRGSFWLAIAERALHADFGAAGAERALGALQHSLAADQRRYRAELRVAQMELRLGRGPAAAAAARRALALEPYAPNALAALGGAQLASGDAAAARDSATAALRSLADYPVALDVRARAAAALGDVKTVNDDRRRLDELAAGCSDDATTAAARRLRPAARAR